MYCPVLESKCLQNVQTREQTGQMEPKLKSLLEGRKVDEVVYGLKM